MDEIICDCKVFFGVDDIEEELTSAEFLRMVKALPAYKGALRAAVETWAREHEAEISEMQTAVKEASSKAMPIALSAADLKSHPKLSAAPAAGQTAPLFDVQQVS